MDGSFCTCFRTETDRNSGFQDSPRRGGKARISWHRVDGLEQHSEIRARCRRTRTEPDWKVTTGHDSEGMEKPRMRSAGDLRTGSADCSPRPVVGRLLADCLGLLRRGRTRFCCPRCWKVGCEATGPSWAKHLFFPNRTFIGQVHADILGC